MASGRNIHCVGNTLLAGLDPTVNANSTQAALEIDVVNLSKLPVKVTGLGLLEAGLAGDAWCYAAAGLARSEARSTGSVARSTDQQRFACLTAHPTHC